jgi:septal ring factor EnvC (AmiA/AmiB activator)
VSQIARADGTPVDHAALLLELIPPHKRHHFTTVAGQEALSGLARGLSAPRYDDSALQAEVARLEAANATLRAQLEQVVAHLRQHEADIHQLNDMLAHHTHETLREVA